MRLGVVSAKYPFGPKEPYLDAELRALAPSLAALAVIPASPDDVPSGFDHVPGEVVRLPVLGKATFALAARAFVRHPLRTLTTLGIVMASSYPPRAKLKNLAVFAKGLAVAEVARARGLDQLHAYWLSTPATVAWIAARVAGIRFSATAHRWDVYENNLAARKVRDAAFVRMVSERGRRDLLALTHGDPAKLHLVRLGVALPPFVRTPTIAGHVAGHWGERTLRILCASALVPVKGHEVLLDALASLRARVVAFDCVLAGEGPLRDAISARIDALELNDCVRLIGNVPHDELLARLEAGEFDVSVIASIERAGGLMEGLPVALIEALAAGVAVVATDSGSIAELIDGRTGILVPHSNAPALADALARLSGDSSFRDRMRLTGRARVESDFDIHRTTAELGALLASVGAGAPRV